MSWKSCGEILDAAEEIILQTPKEDWYVHGYNFMAVMENQDASFGSIEWDMLYFWDWVYLTRDKENKEGAWSKDAPYDDDDKQDRKDIKDLLKRLDRKYKYHHKSH